MTVTSAHPGRGASPRTARAINDRLALRLLQDEGPLTAGQLKELIGMSRPSVADLVERLQDSGLIEVVGESGADRRGPNARVYGIVADRAHVAGLDVRIESIGVEIADLLGRSVARAEQPVAPGTDPARIVEDGIALLLGTARQAGAARLHTIAFGAPGLVDPVTGRLSSSGALPAWHADFVDEVRRRIGVPVLLENEANLAAVAEQRASAGSDDATFVLLWIGGGVGAGVMLDGRLRRGVSGGAGEVGFLPLSRDGELPSAEDCDNGYHGWVGSRAVCALARSHGLSPGAGSDAESAAAAVRAAVDGGADGFLAELAERIALGAASICAVLDPGRVVLAGEVGEAGGGVLAELVEVAFDRLSPLRTSFEVTAVRGGPILRGAVITAMDAAQRALWVR
ncbi:Sugar kinase of the NBD/HSP70 family, may contain an N-terminal HTH domain [Actinacidiphila yanglinensis]|uniref:Sugar kinase of the NBD/HSP70 family, may contain an N-terminal HTH domain n=1 Tax=Actinacidiphila yanglinensis TaxID=310779 RepID=A0A1H6CMM0_9ACTN|nr:ROK family transcriptional regulator [Actinacidiphila yanglinensis]SEG74027.1 Sugar kinase of the NBD/HSP70 family, may contain an N-terminal HTH domain [Actinacidiphila yanglinensis]